MRFSRLAGACALASMVLGAGILPAAPARAQGSTLRVSLNTELQVLDPIVTTINSARVFAYLVFDTLVAIDSQGRFHPQMLEGWEVTPDRMAWRFTLRDGLEFHDGTPVTAEDCVASIRRWAKREAFGTAMMDAVREVQVTGPKTFEFRMSRPFAFVIEALGRSGHQVPVIMPARLANMDAAVPVPEVMGSGPFLFLRNEWRPGERASFIRNPRYRPRAEAPDGLSGGKVARMERVELLSVTDQSTRAAALQSGELDYLEILPPDFVAPMRRNRSVVVGKPAGVDQFLALVNVNHAAPPFNDPKARQALQAAVLQPEVMAAMGLPEDLVVPQCGSIYMCGWAGASEAGTEPLRQAGTERARQLLRESGYRGEPVVFLHAQTSALLNPIGLVVSDQMRRAGFNVDLQSSDYATVAAKRLNRTGWAVAPIVNNGIDLVNPIANPLVAFNCADSSPGWYCDPAMTDLLRRYAVAADPKEQKELADAIQTAMHRNVDYVLAGQFAGPPAWRADLKGVVPFSFPVFWGIERR
ncbi:ABC transporter substrate-binding protein [Pararoseomonas indoligenes]|uniref:ABC transporter substrate-binding protein n=1 Tax=Roseomonas indoligenes TaxID=2820811 RepID=A0A940N095_9PROT|nr:ABC transporter substrate-binding protein [Pararoseomonas indoligenes]MBP0494402.1 ABC transporter substrate-binding protein [Pararoseomonas indoligenes]